MTKQKKKKWRRIVDNKMRDHGETDFEKKTIRVNKSKKKNKKKGEVIDTIVHEEMHVKHPRMHERTVRKRTKMMLKAMPSRVKTRYYNKFKK